jgi:RNA polymerase sigma-70 factor, ECF subfamily
VSNLGKKKVSTDMEAETGSKFDPPVERAEEPTDGMRVQRCLAGDHKAYDALIAKYQRQAVAVSYRLLGNVQDALEVTQDAFLKSFSSLSTLQKPEAFGGWLMRIVSNLSLNYRRGRKVRTRSQLPLDDCLGPTGGGEGASSEYMSRDVDPLHRMESAELGEKLKSALKELPEKQRLAIVMFTIEQLPQKQVADAMGCSIEAVKWHVFQGRKRLREILKDYL